jgi:hypothetical protein
MRCGCEGSNDLSVKDSFVIGVPASISIAALLHLCECREEVFKSSALTSKDCR